MKKKTKHISTLIKQAVGKIDLNAHIILYGSRACGTERVDSDWDILILTDYPVDIVKERMFRNVLYDLKLETGEPFSVFVYSKIDWDIKQIITPFYVNVTNDGVRVDRDAYVQNRIETAYKTLDAAKVLTENGFWNSTVNRLYYSVFYVVNAILVKHEIIIQSHSGAKSQFYFQFA